MESAESNIRIPGVLMPSYLRLTSTEEGKSAMKRIRLECGVCKATRFYSIHRGITRIAGVVACEACRQFYQRFKKQPWVLNCNKGGRCYEMDETPKSKCKACWVAHIICRCPVPMGLYNHLVGYLPTELKSKMAGRPPTSDEVPEKERGGLGLEIYKDNDWVDVTDKEEVESLLRTEEGNETDETNEPEMDVEIEIEDMMDDSGIPEESSPPKPPNGKNNRQRQKRGKKSEKSESDPDDRVMASLIEGLQVNNQFKFMENFNPKTSERVRRKKKKVQYFSSSGRNKNQMQQAYHGPDGRILSSGKDLCDCLQPSCPGCHYPCPKCNSSKCGNECRINRKWFYEKVEVEGTQISWTNEYVKKN
ncbi:uncharacterized protein LOC125030619 isoform X2 [Penaeus chinensis]|uniref:uncharacterized protein LOC125030619 isoform X2 n=1 Tax=Penaeus chinensis TaxID=139456 RepID=UPI001FB5F1F5|nr:uncharacterized protein LOC125030619 isoform X2 [Penaeus chinensis]